MVEGHTGSLGQCSVEEREEIKEELNPEQDELKESVSKVILARVQGNSCMPEDSPISKLNLHL